jgi:addiction module HigA family antidote
MAEGKLKPIHPGEVLSEEFLKPFGISADDLAKSIGIQAKNVEEIVSGNAEINADIALRLAKYFGTSAQFWLGLQSDYDLDVTRETLGDRLEKEIVPLAA